MTASLTQLHGETDEDIVQGARALDRKACEWLDLPTIEVPGDFVFAKREYLRQAARRAPKPSARCLVDHADAAYWQLVQHHAPGYQWEVRRHARASRVDEDMVQGALYESAYRCAIEWDPARASFSTALRAHLRGGWQRAPERQHDVALGPSAIGRTRGGFGRTRNFDLGETEPVNLRDDVYDLVHRQVDIERMERAAEHLPERQRALFFALLNGAQQADVAREVGVKRQRMGQIYMQMLAGLRTEMGVEQLG